MEAGYQDMEPRASWKPFLANIAIAATGIGLLLIIGKYLTTGTSFFSQTNRHNIIVKIDSALENIKHDNTASQTAGSSGA
jgi:hypothetical protein